MSTELIASWLNSLSSLPLQVSLISAAGSSNPLQSYGWSFWCGQLPSWVFCFAKLSRGPPGIITGSASVFQVSSSSIYWALHIYVKDFVVQERYLSIFYSVLVWWILSSRTHQNELQSIPSWLYCGFFECLITRMVTITIITHTTLKVYRTESWFRPGLMWTVIYN